LRFLCPSGQALLECDGGPVYPDEVINIRDLSVRCGHCSNFMTLASYAPRDGWNAYTFECDGGTCDAAAARTVVEVPVALDEFAQRGCPTEG
jgi:hypothetical protein